MPLVESQAAKHPPVSWRYLKIILKHVTILTFANWPRFKFVLPNHVKKWCILEVRCHKRAPYNMNGMKPFRPIFGKVKTTNYRGDGVVESRDVDRHEASLDFTDFERLKVAEKSWSEMRPSIQTPQCCGH